MLNTTNDELRISISVIKHINHGYELELGYNENNNFGWKNLLISCYKNKELALLGALTKLEKEFSENDIINKAIIDTIANEIDRRVQHYETCKKGKDKILKAQHSAAQTTLVTLKMWINKKLNNGK